MMFKYFSLIGFFFLSQNSLADAPSNYYDTVDASSSEILRSSLHAVIDDHIWFPYTSSRTDTWDILKLADEDEDNGNNITAIYKNSTYVKQNGGNNFYNREHSWPNSYGFPDRGPSNYPYSDTHHLFLADIAYNSDRGNKYFDDCSTGCSSRTTVANDGQGGNSDEINSFDSTRWEVWSKRKGDIARAMFYMDIRYEGGTHAFTQISEPNLILTNNPALIQTSGGNNASQAYMGLLDTLIQWHLDDPVVQEDIDRNDVIQMFQGNRNPFVDHPEWVECLYLDQCQQAIQVPLVYSIQILLGLMILIIQYKPFSFTRIKAP